MSTAPANDLVIDVGAHRGEGSLTIVDRAISESAGPLTFYANRQLSAWEPPTRSGRLEPHPGRRVRSATGRRRAPG